MSKLSSARVPLPLPDSVIQRQQTGQTPARFDYFLRYQQRNIKGNRVIMPFTIPQPNPKIAMAHVEFIADTLKRDIQNWRLESFDNFGIDVRVYPVPSAYDFHDGSKSRRWVGFSHYYFEPFGSEAKPMEVTVTDKLEVLLRYGKGWKPVFEYLKHLRPPYDPWADQASTADLQHQRWRKQADWWKENGKVFNIMKLPPELRTNVYEHVWGDFVVPYPLSKKRRLTPLGKIGARLRIPNVNLLRANHKVAEEASDMLFMRTHFYIDQYSILQSLTTNVEQRSRIRNLTLAFSHEELMTLFSTTHKRRDKKTKKEIIGLGYPALALRSMKLNRLRLVFAPPSAATPSDRFDSACQRVAIDMIMDFAWPVLRGQPVEFCGYIKDLQKKMYMARDSLERQRVRAWQKRRAQYGLEEGTLADYDDELDEEVGGVPLDEESRPETEPEEVATIEFDLTCHCDPPCTEATWTSEG